MKKIANALTASESSSLFALESNLEAARKSVQAQYVIVGESLTAIRDQKLYREHGTFETYVQKRWQIGRARAYQLMDASEAAKNVHGFIDIPNPGVAIEIAKLPTKAAQRDCAKRLAQAEKKRAKSGKRKSPTIRETKEAVAETELDEDEILKLPRGHMLRRQYEAQRVKPEKIHVQPEPAKLFDASEIETRTPGEIVEAWYQENKARLNTPPPPPYRNEIDKIIATLNRLCPSN